MQSSNLGTLTQELMGILVPDDLSDVSEVLQQIGWKRTGAAMLLLSIYKKACSGDVSAAKLIREMNDETSSDETSVDAKDMTDAMLYKMIGERIGDGSFFLSDEKKEPSLILPAVDCLPLRQQSGRAVLNDIPVDCQSREVTDPRGEGGTSPQTGVGEVARAE